MKHILFVDDEQMVLDGLKRSLRGMKHEWTMTFACGGEEALRVLARLPIDVVVSDMRMPGMDGGQLLREVRQQYPHVVRIILSGQSDREMVFKSISSMHLFLSKPCDTAVLQSTIRRVCALRDVLKSEGLRALVGGMHSIPSIPRFYAEIRSLLESNTYTLKAVSEVISKDPGMTAKVLQLVNSPYFGLDSQAVTVEQAVNLLGSETIQSLTLTAHVFSAFPQEKAEAFHLERLWAEGMETGLLARRIAKSERRPAGEVEQAFVAGLLHDAGVILFAANRSETYGQVLEQAAAGTYTMGNVEEMEFGASHAEVGAYLLGLWGISDAIVEAVARHHTPGASPGDNFTPLTAVHVADAILQERGKNVMNFPPSMLDMAYLTRLKLADRVPRWRALAEGGDALAA